MFTNAIVRTPASSLALGLSANNLGRPDYGLALQQHEAYIAALESCGLNVRCLDPLLDFPDSTFIEDVALLTPHCGVITNPGAPSRRGEVNGLITILDEYYGHVERIQPPGTLEAGDVMMVDSHFYIGLSARTNRDGADQLIQILTQYDLTGSVINLKEVLHLKTGVAYLEHNNLLACGEFLTKPDFESFNLMPVDPLERYAANCIWVNDKVLVPAGFPRTSAQVSNAGYKVLEVDVSEFRKLDGGLSCLSLRF